MRRYYLEDVLASENITAVSDCCEQARVFAKPVLGKLGKEPQKNCPVSDSSCTAELSRGFSQSGPAVYLNLAVGSV